MNNCRVQMKNTPAVTRETLRLLRTLVRDSELSSLRSTSPSKAREDGLEEADGVEPANPDPPVVQDVVEVAGDEVLQGVLLDLLRPATLLHLEALPRGPLDRRLLRELL